MPEDKEKLARKVARAKAGLLWGLILDSPKTEDLAKPLEERTRFRELPDEHKVTILALVTEFERGCRAIEEDAKARETREAAIDVAPVGSPEEAPPDDGNGTGEETPGEESPTPTQAA
jgi:hypothetical protein